MSELESARVYDLDTYRQRGRPRLWSDFDGTAVEHLPKWDPRNWSKYPLPMKEGYTTFLHGAQHGGLELGGIVSRRPELRRAATFRSMAQLGIDHYFDEKHAFHFGSEEGKANHLIAEAAERKTALIDDKPHKVGKYLVDTLAHGRRLHPLHTIVIGVVDGTHSHEDTDELLQDVRRHTSEVERRNHDFNAFFGNAALAVRQLAPFSEAAGEEFAEQVRRVDSWRA